MISACSVGVMPKISHIFHALSRFGIFSPSSIYLTEVWLMPSFLLNSVRVIPCFSRISWILFPSAFLLTRKFSFIIYTSLSLFLSPFLFCPTFFLISNESFLSRIFSMPNFDSILLTSRSFSWSAGTKKDGSRREAGESLSLIVQEKGPSLQTSTVIEVQIPPEIRPTVHKFLETAKRGQDFRFFGEALGKMPTDQLQKVRFVAFCQ